MRFLIALSFNCLQILGTCNYVRSNHLLLKSTYLLHSLFLKLLNLVNFNAWGWIKKRSHQQTSIVNTNRSTKRNEVIMNANDPVSKYQIHANQTKNQPENCCIINILKWEKLNFNWMKFQLYEFIFNENFFSRVCITELSWVELMLCNRIDDDEDTGSYCYRCLLFPSTLQHYYSIFFFALVDFMTQWWLFRSFCTVWIFKIEKISVFSRMAVFF